MKLPRVQGDKVVRALMRAGFEEIRIHGSHHILYHRGKDVIITVPVHSGKVLAPKTLKSILESARITAEEFRQLL